VGPLLDELLEEGVVSGAGQVMWQKDLRLNNSAGGSVRTGAEWRE